MGYFDDDEDAVEYAPSWKPEAGDEIAGKVVSISKRDGNFGPYPIITLEQDNGEQIAFHAFHSVPKRELEDLEPRQGDYMAIKYVGKQVTRAGTPFHNYKLKKLQPEQRTDASAAQGRTSKPAVVDSDGNDF